MKNGVRIGVALAAVCLSALVMPCMGNTVVYTTDDYIGYDYTSGGGQIQKANGWSIALYWSANGSIDAFGSTDDHWLQTFTGTGAWSQNGVAAVSFDYGVGTNVFLRVFNSSSYVNDGSVGTATEYVNLNMGAVYNVAAGDPQYWFGTGTSSGGGDWIALPVPEPATLCLLGMGGLAMVAVRRRRQKV
ncbi:MAG: PEP-CTERM sorting domain-containing protein [bacterium]